MQTNNSNTFDANTVSINSFSFFGAYKDSKSPCFPCTSGAKVIWTIKQVCECWERTEIMVDLFRAGKSLTCIRKKAAWRRQLCPTHTKKTERQRHLHCKRGASSRQLFSVLSMWELHMIFTVNLSNLLSSLHAPSKNRTGDKHRLWRQPNGLYKMLKTQLLVYDEWRTVLAMNNDSQCFTLFFYLTRIQVAYML